MLGIESAYFILPTIITYTIIVIVSYIYLIRAIKSGFYNRENVEANRKRIRKGSGTIISLVGAGTFSNFVIFRNFTENTKFVIYGLAFLIMGYIFEIGILNIHKYYFIKKYSRKAG